jgi:hypothetical protein
MNKFTLHGLLTVVALASLTGTASATVVTSNGSAYTSTFTAESSNLNFHSAFYTVDCNRSHLEGKFESHGSSTTAEGKISKWTFEACNYSITVRKPGTLIAHAGSGGNGTLTSTGTELVMHTSVGECILTTSATSIGTFTGGGGAVLDIDSSTISRTGGSFFCGSSVEWTGNYTFSAPTSLVLD